MSDFPIHPSTGNMTRSNDQSPTGPSVSIPHLKDPSHQVIVGIPHEKNSQSYVQAPAPRAVEPPSQPRYPPYPVLIPLTVSRSKRRIKSHKVDPRYCIYILSVSPQRLEMI